MKIIVPSGIRHSAHIPCSLRCPYCGKEAMMEKLGEYDYMVNNEHVCGQRQCPNPECQGHVFVVFKQGRVLKSYPPSRLDFNSDNIPSGISQTFMEAITCHSECCYVAAAIMVRRTLEEICSERQAVGKDLKARIADLRTRIVLPSELLEAIDELRILGNDAAHIVAKSYDNVSEPEVTAAIEVTKEILKSIYQYVGLLDKLRALKKQP